MSLADPGRREVAHRIFAAEFDDATFTYTESDEERAPNYVVSPTGARINRLFLVGVLTEVEWVNEETVRARIVDPTGPFVVYASQYQPDARAALDEAEPPTFLAVTGKANVFRPDGGDRIYSSVRPEAVSEVDAETRDRWAVSTAKLTLGRVAKLAAAMEGDETPSAGVEIALNEYEPTPGYVADLYNRCVDVLRLMAGEIDSMPALELSLETDASPSVSLRTIIEIGDHVPTPAENTSGLGSIPSTEKDSDAGTDEETDEADNLDLDDPVDSELPPIGSDDASEEVLTSEERAEVESSFGTDFTTGDEIEVSDEDPLSTSAANDIEDDDEAHEMAGDALEQARESPGDDLEKGDETRNNEEDAPAEAASVDDLVTLMRSLDEGEGIARETLLETGSDRLSIDRSAVEALLQSALLEGQCYEASDDVIQPI